MGNSKKSMFKVGVGYSMASSLSTICAMLIGFLNMRWLGPELLGIWQSLTIINAYLPILQIGIQSGLNLELPIAIGARKKSKARKFVSTALFFAIVLALALFIVAAIVVVIMICKHFDEKYILGVGAVSIIAICSCFRLHYIATYRSANAFDKLSKIYLFDCVVSVVLIYFIYHYGYFGLLLYHVVEYVVLTALMFVFAPYRGVLPYFHKYYFFSLLKRGIFMTIYNQIKSIIQSVPKLVLLKFGGTIFVGLFNPVIAVGSCMNMIPTQVAQFLHPQMGLKYGQSRRAMDLWKYLKTLSFLVPIVMIPVAIVGWYIIPYAMTYLFPKYVDSIRPIQIMLIGYVFSSSYLTRGFLITIKAYVRVLFLICIDLLLFVCFPLLIINLRGGNVMVGLSIGMSIGYVISYVLNFFIVWKTIQLKQYN